METPCTTLQTYIDAFNPLEYYNTFYAPVEGKLTGEWTDFVFRNLHETFSPGGVRGDTLIDFGSGPTIYQVLTACDVFNNIILSDLLEQNRAELQKWLRKDPDALDWTHMIKCVCELEGNRENYEEKAEKLRSKVKQVLKCDALKSNPYDPIVLPPADCLLTCLCLENPCKDMESYCNVLKNFKNLLNPGGHLLVLSMVNATFYYVGNKRITVLTVSQNDLEMAFKKAGYEIKKLIVTPRIDVSRKDIFDAGSRYFVHACKPK
ncbi:indolethylamine N-methyltransferase-like isoform X2 [Pseudophryne corroboree]|uniref:indolethylamine N-methyltransferase-like isoform X2 n=1 Tax=Pseudophryne corroboree TaxID=495146 RepID=UPI0030818915